MAFQTSSRAAAVALCGVACGPTIEDIPEMVRIEHGSFTMGSPADEVGRQDGEVQHEVTLTRDFEVSVFEVTQAQFELFAGYDAPCRVPGCDLCAVYCLRWHEAAYFANNVSDAAGLEPCYECWSDSWADPPFQCGVSPDPYRCEGYRLPTEAEWEYAARAGSTSAFSNGGGLVTDSCDGAMLDDGTPLGDIAYYCAGSDAHPAKVGGLAPNPWGLYDMHGNVPEWCHDRYQAYDDAATDPVYLGPGPGRVLRGGAWDDSPGRLRSASRDWKRPAYSGGIRLVRSD